MTQQIRPQIKFFLRTSAIVNSMEEHYAQKDLVFGNVGDHAACIEFKNFKSECPEVMDYHYRDQRVKLAQNIYQNKGWDLNYPIDLPIDLKDFVARIEYKPYDSGHPLVFNKLYCTCIGLHHKKYGWETIKEREIELEREKKWWFFKTKNFVRCEDCYLR